MHCSLALLSPSRPLVPGHSFPGSSIRVQSKAQSTTLLGHKFHPARRERLSFACAHPTPMQAEASSSPSSPLVPARFATLIWSCLDADLHKSAVFYAERYYAMYQESHDARHLYATALLHAGQPHSAHHLVNAPVSATCAGCLEVKAKCCTALGRHRHAREALEACLRDPRYTPSCTSYRP